jgi:hypothetical protein
VDILFVIDNSESMADEQAMLQGHFPALLTVLRNMQGGLPNLHFGVTSTDLGTSPYQIPSCGPGGDAGNLLTGSCTNPALVPYIVDVAPSGCEITQDASGCSAHTCSQAHCAHEPSTHFVIDGNNCPRCRNYAGESLEDVYSCLTSLGIWGCDFEQPLEAMVQALDSANTHNAGFLRDNALLAVVFITDEDDCSASDPSLFDDSQTGIDSALGPLTSYRCFEFGVTCDINDRMHLGLRQDCVPREDSAALLHPASRYIAFLESIKDPQLLVIAAIAGPVYSQTVTVGWNELDQPEVQFSCSTDRGGGRPGIRMKSVIEAFNQEDDLGWAYTSICAPTYTDAGQGVGSRITDILAFQCLPAPLKGCADPGVEFGLPQMPQHCAVNEQCRPECTVIDVYHRGTPDEVKAGVPPCLEICPSGPCPGNTLRSAAYALGHPLLRDADLPVPACWYINFQERCPQSNYAELVISRRTDPPARTFAEVHCRQILQSDLFCHDGFDNDEDCLVDEADPDCNP